MLISSRIVEANSRPLFELVKGLAAMIRVRLPQNHLRAEDYGQCVVPVRQCQSCDRFVKELGPDASVDGRIAMNQKAVNVGPVGSGVRRVPHNSFATNVPRRCNANWLGSHWTPMPASRPPSMR